MLGLVEALLRGMIGATGLKILLHLTPDPRGAPEGKS